MPDGQPNPFFADHKQGLAALREACVVGSAGPRAVRQEEDEWHGLPTILRFFVLTGAGMEDPDDALRRAWREFPHSERMAIRATLREWHRRLRSLYALTL